MIADPILLSIVAVAFSVFLVGLVLRALHQPHVIIYILAGILIGPFGLQIIKDSTTLTSLGNLGVILLLFFAGMQVSLPRLVSNWKVAIGGTIGLTLVSVLFTTALGSFLSWSFEKGILMGFVISLSSTSVILKIMEERNEMDTKVGQNVLGITLAQDLAIIPMLIIIDLFGGQGVHIETTLLQLFGGVAIVGGVAWLLRKGQLKIPFADRVRNDTELQVFVGLVLCFGLASVTALLGLSTAMGAFIAGIIVSSAKESSWVQGSLDSLRVIFVALFFISVGMLVNIPYIVDEWHVVLLVLLVVFAVNTLINALVLRWLGDTWKESLYAGALLAQVGEFSFVLAAAGLQNGALNQDTYHLIMAVIALSLVMSPFWILFIRKFLHIDKNYVFEAVKSLPRKMMGVGRDMGNLLKR